MLTTSISTRSSPPAGRRRSPRTASSFTATPPPSIAGIIPSSPHPAVTIGDDYGRYPEHVAHAVALLRAADIDGPYAVALGSRCFTGVTETTEHGGYPVFHHLREILGGPVVWAPAVDGAVVLSQRGGDFEITIGEDFSIGYTGADADVGAAVHRGECGVPRQHS